MEKKNRRKFIEKGAATVVAAAAMSLPAMASKTTASDANRPPVVHHVFFWLKDPTSTADRDKLVAGLKTLAGIPLIKELYVGVLANTEKRDVVDASWQVSELMFFEDLSAQANYQQHPLHVAFVKNCSPLWEKVVVYDAMNLYNRIG
jgi:Stress responsive A/B Barrel Domain